MSRDTDRYIIDGAFGEYGFDSTNPIPVDGPDGEMDYLSRLTCPCGVPFAYHRLQISGVATDAHVLDAYELLCFNKSHRYTIYLDMYHKSNRFKPPRGLALSTQHLGVGANVTLDDLDRKSPDQIERESPRGKQKEHYREMGSALRQSLLPVFVYGLLGLVLSVVMVVLRRNVFEIIGCSEPPVILMALWFIATPIIAQLCHSSTTYWYERIRGEPYRKDMMSFGGAWGYDIAHGAGLLAFLIQFALYGLALPRHATGLQFMRNPWSFLALYFLWSQLFTCVLAQIVFRIKVKRG